MLVSDFIPDLNEKISVNQTNNNRIKCVRRANINLHYLKILTKQNKSETFRIQTKRIILPHFPHLNPHYSL